MLEPEPTKQPLFGLNPIEFQALQLTAATFAIRALIANHPNPNQVRASYDQLLGQLQASAAVAGQDANQGRALRSITNGIFQAPVVL